MEDLGHARIPGGCGVAETRFARSGQVDIAYQVIGDGPVDLVLVPGWISHCELNWELPELARFLGRFAEFGRAILLDIRGVGLSDRVAGIPTLEDHVADLDAVLRAAGSERAALCAGGTATSCACCSRQPIPSVSWR